MKIALSLLAAVFFLLPCFAQKAVVMPERNNELAIGIDNPLSVVVENTSCDSVRVKASEGRITVISRHACRYVFYTDKPGSVSMMVSRKKNGKWVYVTKYWFRTTYLPDPTAMIGGKTGGEFSRDLLIAQGGIVAELLNSEFQANAQVLRYTVLINHGDTCLYNTLHNTGARYNEPVLAALKTLKANDTVTFKDIYVQWFGHEVLLIPIIFKISE